MDKGRNDIETLLQIITRTAQDAMNQYTKAGYDVPRVDAHGIHPIDSRYEMVELKKIVQTLEHSCRKLCTTLAQTAQTIGDRMLMVIEPACLRVAVECKVADILENAPDGMHVEEIAKNAKIDSDKLVSVMRRLVTKDCFREVSLDVYANNRLSLTLLSSNPISSSVSIWTDDFNLGFSKLFETYSDKDYAFSYRPNKAAVLYAVKNTYTAGGGAYDWYNQNPTKRERFARGMIGWGNIIGSMAALQCPIWDELPKGTSVCDVGSGIGGFTIKLLEKYSGFKVILCDLPDVVGHAKEYWTSANPSAVQERRANFVPIDFLKEALEGHDVYYARLIMHNWRDPEAHIILHNIRQVMKPGAKILINDFVLPDRSYDGEEIEVLEDSSARLEKMLSTMGSSKVYDVDITVLALLNSKERTLEQYNNLGAQASLKLGRHWNLGDISLLEFTAC